MNGGWNLPGSIHHGETAEVAAGEGHHNACYNISPIIVYQNWQGTGVRLEVTEHEEWDEESS